MSRAMTGSGLWGRVLGRYSDALLWASEARLARASTATIIVTVGMLLVSALIGPAREAHALAFSVTTTADELNSDGDCSLREAIQATNLDTPVDACPPGDFADHITLPAGTYVLDKPDSAGLVVTEEVFLRGEGAGKTIIDGGNRFIPALRVDNASGNFFRTTVGSLTIRNFNDVPLSVEQGTALTLHESVVTDNSSLTGGGIYNSGSTWVARSTISANDGGARGGGIANSSGADLRVHLSTIRDNVATGGAGITNSGQLVVTNSTISGNRAALRGGGIVNTGTTLINNSTITNNVGNTRRDFSSDTYNGGGIKNVSPGTVALSNTILAGNTDGFTGTGLSHAGPDCYGTLTSNRNNIIGNNTNCVVDDPNSEGTPFDQVGTPSAPIDPLLEPLADNGGPTRTHALRPGSPAIDKGSAAAPGSDNFACESNDQRGASRPYDGDGDGTAVCDVGAYEYGADIIAPTAQSPTQSLVANSTLGTSTVPVKISWSATDNPGGSGVTAYELQRSVGGSAYTAVTLPSPTTTTVTQSLDPGKTYRFRVRAEDDAGNVGEWSEGPQFEVKALQENDASVAYPSGTWTRSQLSGAYGGYVKYAGALGAKARLSFTGRNVAWVAPKANNRGKAEVWLDGTRVATVDLYSSSALSRRVVFQRAVDPSRSHVLEVRVLGTKNASSTGKRVDVDAFVVLR